MKKTLRKNFTKKNIRYHSRKNKINKLSGGSGSRVIAPKPIILSDYTDFVANINTDLKFFLIEFIKNETIQSLMINNIDESQAQIFAEELNKKPNLTTLYINYTQTNAFYSEGAIAIAKALETNGTLTTLFIVGNRIGDIGAIAIAKALEINGTLTTLYISGNNINVEGANAIAKALETNTTLTMLNINSNNIGDAGAIEIAKALETNKTLSKLYTANNNIGNAGAIELVKALNLT
jgi:Ran GTPase-activating protein (RanGAP) involved in mRNA processing and transport